MKVHHITPSFLTILLFSLSTIATDALSEANYKAGLTKDKPYMYVMHKGRSVKVERIQDPEFMLTGYFAKTARNCPPFCFQPISVAPGVATIGEIELFAFMDSKLKDQKGLLVDARTPEWYNRGTIPGSINIPFNTLNDLDSADAKSALARFGAKQRSDIGTITLKFEELIGGNQYKTDKWDFTDAKDLVVWCNSPQCGQSPRAIRSLLEVGYPADKILYYRGGMQLWKLWGLSTVAAEN
jgi:rhodanese-related sulfurtransferase